MANLTEFFQEQAIKDGVATIIENVFMLDIEPKHMDRITDTVFRMFEEMPIYGIDDDGGYDMEAELFLALLHMMIRNILLNAKVKALQRALEDK